MPVEEITSGILSIAARVIGWFFVEVLLHIVCGGIGWLVIKLITFGKYPTKYTKEEPIMLVGFLILLIPVAVLTFYVS